VKDFSWSYSIYSAFARCPRLGKLLYVDNVEEPGPESGDLLFGTCLHSAINAILSGEEGGEVFQIYWDTYKEKEIDYGRFKWEELKNLGNGFCSKFTRLHSKKYTVEQAESRLYGSYRGVRLEGTPDFIGVYDGKKSLRDFKTSGYNYQPEKKLIALQLNLYAYLAYVSTGFLPETLGYTVFCKGTGSIQDQTWDFNMKTMYAQLDEMMDHIELLSKPEGKFPKNVGACLYPRKCGMFDVCHGGSNA
jgi:hypothetical protein